MQTEIAKLIVAFEARTAQMNAEMSKLSGRIDTFSKNTERSMARTTSAFSKSQAAFGKYIKGFVGFYLVTQLFRKIVTSTKNAEESFARLKIAVQNNGTAATKTAEQYAAYATQLQGTSTFSDESIQDAISQLLAFKNLGVTIEQATQLSVDLAARMKKDLPEAAKIVAKALADPAHAVKMLKEAGVVLTEDQKKVIKKLNELGETARASRFIFDELSRSTVGAGEAMRNNFSGALTGLGNDLENLLEAKTGLPVLTDAINKFAEMARDPAVRAGIDSLLGNFVLLLGAALALIGKVSAALSMLPSPTKFLPFGSLIEHFAAANAPQPVTNSGPHSRTGSGGLATFNPIGETSEALAASVGAMDAAKAHRKEVEKTTEAVNKQIEALQMQVLAFGASAAGAAGLEVTQGELGKQLASMGPAGDIARQKYLELTIALEELKLKTEAESEALEANKQLHEDINAALAATRTAYQVLSDQIDIYVGWLTTVDEATGKTLITLDQYYSLVQTATASFVEDANKAKKAADEMSIQWDQALRNMQDILADALFNSFDDGLRGMLYSWAIALKRMAAEALAANIFGALTAGAKSASGGGGFFSGLLGAFLGAFSPGGGAAAAAGGGGGGGGGAMFGGGMADGGPIRPNKWYMVGEQGPELIRSAAHGMVLPTRTTQALLRGDSAHSTPSRSVSVTMNITTPDANSFMRTQQQIQARMSTALTRASARNN